MDTLIRNKQAKKEGRQDIEVIEEQLSAKRRIWRIRENVTETGEVRLVESFTIENWADNRAEMLRKKLGGYKIIDEE